MPKWLTIKNITMVASLILNLLGGTGTVKPIINLSSPASQTTK